jgi:hypothetical protein
MNLSETQLDWLRLPLFWVLVSAIGGVAAYFAVPLIGSAAALGLFNETIPGLVFAGAPMGGALAGLLVGAGQWLVLRRYQARAWVWVPATIIGWSLGLFATTGLFFWLVQDGLGYITLILPMALGGGVIAYAQGLILRRWMRITTSWWILANAMGLVVGWIIALGLASGASQSASLPPGAGLAVLGALHGAFVGLESGVAIVAFSALANYDREKEANDH